MKKIFLFIFFMVTLCFSSEEVRIDFGDYVSPSDGNWNNISYENQNMVVSNLIDYNTGNPTSISYTGSNWTTYGSLGWLNTGTDWFIESAAGDCFGSTSPNSEIVLSGLSDSKYQIEFVSSFGVGNYTNSITINSFYSDRTEKTEGNSQNWDTQTQGYENEDWLIWDNVTPIDGKITINFEFISGYNVANCILVKQSASTLPTINDVADISTNEDTPTSAIAVTIHDDDGDAMSLTGTSSNTSLVPNANIVVGGSGDNRTVTITPTENQFGTTTVTLTVDDNSEGTATDTFVLTVESVDDEIVVNSLAPAEGPVSINELEAVNFVIEASDPDGKDLEYSWKLDGAEVSTEATYDFITSYTSAGDYVVTLDVTDNFGVVKNSFTKTWDVTVVDVDQNIIVSNLEPAEGPVSINELETVNFAIEASDPDGKDLVYSWKLDGAEVSTEATYDFVTDYTSAGDYVVTLDVTDNFGVVKNAFTKTWNVTVVDIDQNIVVNSLSPAEGTISIEETQDISFAIDASDPDGNALTYSWKLDGAEVATSAAYDYVSDYSSAGSHEITLDATDNFGSKNTVSYSWTIEVSDLEPSVSPESITETLNQLENVTRNITLTNKGYKDLEYRISMTDIFKRVDKRKRNLGDWADYSRKGSSKKFPQGKKDAINKPVKDAGDLILTMLNGTINCTSMEWVVVINIEVGAVHTGIKICSIQYYRDVNTFSCRYCT